MDGTNFNPYEILGVDRDTSIEDVKKQYKLYCKEQHPDKGGSSEDFVNLKKAFDILTDPIKRNLYDEYGVHDSLDIEAEAKLIAVQIVVQALDSLPDSCDMDKEIAGIFTRTLERLQDQERASKQARDRLRRRLDSIQRKPDNDFLTKEIANVIENHNRKMKSAQLNYRIYDNAFKLVQDYQFDIAKIAFTGYNTITVSYLT